LGGILMEPARDRELDRQATTELALPPASLPRRMLAGFLDALVLATALTGFGATAGATNAPDAIDRASARPDFIVETGVAAGLSTSFFGAALIDNQHGTLYSIELPPTDTGPSTLADGSRYAWHEHGVGWAIPKSIRTGLVNRHHLVLQNVRQALPELLRQIPHVDIFFHDDLHTPDHMLWEYQLIWPHIRSGGTLISDDANFGWIQFCKQLGQGERAYENISRLAAIRKP